MGYVWDGMEESCLSAYQRRIGARRGDGRRCGKKGGCTLAAVEKPLTVGFMFVEVCDLLNRGEGVFATVRVGYFSYYVVLCCCVWYMVCW